MGDGRSKNQKWGDQDIRKSRRLLPLLELVGQKGEGGVIGTQKHRSTERMKNRDKSGKQKLES